MYESIKIGGWWQMKLWIYRRKKVSHKIKDLLKSSGIGKWWYQEFVDGCFYFASCPCHSQLWIQLLGTALRNWANHPAKGCLTQCRSKRMLGDRKIWQLEIRRNRPTKKGTLWRWLRAPGFPNLVADNTPWQIPYTFTNNVIFSIGVSESSILFKEDMWQRMSVARITYVFILDTIPFLPKYHLHITILFSCKCRQSTYLYSIIRCSTTTKTFWWHSLVTTWL